jgi:hypothetical protein
MSLSTEQVQQLLNNAKYLNDRLLIASDTRTASQIIERENDIYVQKTVLSDIQDGIETYNREFIERENELVNKPNKKMFYNLQDWGLFILFGGYFGFSLAILIYIFLYSKKPLLLGCIFMFITAMLTTLIVFMIQRFG